MHFSEKHFREFWEDVREGSDGKDLQKPYMELEIFPVEMPSSP